MLDFMQKTDAKPSIKGKTTIDHRICSSLNIGFTEYVLLDYFNDNPGVLDADKLYRSKGVSHDTLAFFTKTMERQKLITCDNNEYKVTKKWAQYFSIDSDFDNEEKANPGFWQIFKKHGNKQMAKKAYVKARKVVDKETLHNAAIGYMKSKEGNDVFLHASTYLNPETRHWEDIVKIKGEEEEQKKGIYQGSILQKRNPNAKQV